MAICCVSSASSARAAASTAAAVSSLLDASLFAAPAEGAGEDAAASKAALGGQMAGTVGALATGLVANAFGGQSFPLSTPIDRQSGSNFRWPMSSRPSGMDYPRLSTKKSRSFRRRPI